MAAFSKIEVLNRIYQDRMIPLFYHSDEGISVEIVKSCYQGGARLMEFTARGDGADEVMKALLKEQPKSYPEMIIGVGSITDAAAASRYIGMGVNFVVTASFFEDIAQVCNRRKIPYLPGCGSLKEISIAEQAGVDIVKLFPGAVYGPGFVKAIKGPQPWSSIMPTGGVTLERENLKSWFDAGVVCVGIGSNLISKTLVEERRFKDIQKNTETVLKIIKSLNL